MNITSYRFGRIEIDGRTYSKDLLMFPDHIRENWWRERGHSLNLSELEEVLEFHPDRLIVGCGFFSMLKVPASLIAALEARGISCTIMASKDAVRAFNESVGDTRVVLGIHLTC